MTWEEQDEGMTLRGIPVSVQKPHKHAALARRLEMESEQRQAALSAFYAQNRARALKAKRSARRGSSKRVPV